MSYLSDNNGISNRYIAEFDSVITHVDTSAHYRYYTRDFPVTDYSRSVVSHDVSYNSGQIAEIIHAGQRMTIYLENQPEQSPEPPVKPEKTAYMEQNCCR